MAKTDNLKDYLKDLYDGIKTKKPYASRNPQNFRAEIESIQTGTNLVPLTNPATTDHIWYGKETYDDKGKKIVGSLPYNGDVSQVIDGITTDNVVIPSGITSGGTVSLTTNLQDEVDIQEDLIEEIIAILNNKVASSGGDEETLKGLIEGSLTELVIPEGTTEIRRYAFAYLSNLKSISIPDSILKIGDGAFYGVNYLNTNADVAIDGYSVRYLGNDNNKYLVAYNTTNIYIPTVILHESTRIIAPSAFSGKSKLKSFTFSNNVKFIGSNAFSSCKELTNLVIPSSVLEIDMYALQIGSSTNKATIRFESTTPPTISTSIFNASYLDKIEVPMASVEAYKTKTNWSNFADYIEGYE